MLTPAHSAPVAHAAATHSAPAAHSDHVAHSATAAIAAPAVATPEVVAPGLDFAVDCHSIPALTKMTETGFLPWENSDI